MASNDIRDIMDVGPSAEARPAKKQKVAASKNKDQYAGMSKEVRGLMMGDGVPPVQVQENRYKTKPKIAKRAQPWIREPFTNPARTDGLVLTHWIRGGNMARPDTPGGTGAPVTPADSKTENDGETAKAPPAMQSNYHFAKYNTKPSGPEYTDEEYEKHLKSEKWSKEETDYLVQLALGLDLRWVVIWDRYDFSPQETSGQDDSMAVTVTPRQRSMEEMKARYYEVSAGVMTIHHPLSSMSTAEFDLHEKMTKFDPNREATRKRLAEALLARSPDELREEEVLLGELKRITDNEDRFLEERKELYQRLDHPQSHGSIALYESSAGLINLMQNLLQSDKNKKRRSITGPEANSSPAQNGPTQTPTSAHPSHRGSVSQTSNKKGSVSQGIQPRLLSQRDEIRFGVSRHDRLSPGVSFRQGRIEKLVLAKSAAQQQKLHDALGHLGIPVRAVMPTTKVCAEYERLVAAVHALLDARKVSEKIQNEIRVLKASKELREKKERATEDGQSQDGDNDQSEDAKMEDDAEKVEDEDKSEVRDVSDNEEEQNEEDEDQDQDNDEDDDQQDEDAEGENDNEDLEEADGEAEAEEEDAEAEVDGENDGDHDEDIDQDGDDLEDEDGDEDAGEDGEEEGDDDADEDAEEPEVEDEPSTKAASHKRSASVLSLGSEKSTKKTRR